MRIKNKKGRFKEIRELRIKNFLVLTLAGIINSFGVSLFLFPVKLYDSGISGLSMLLDQITPSQLTLSLFLLLLNIPIFLFGLKKQGLLFTVYSLYTILVYSLASFLIMHVLPIDLDFVSPLAGSDLLLCAVFGGLISGVGSGLTIRYGGAMDGIDVMSVIFAKKIGISIGSFVMAFNAVLYIVCGIVIQSWILPLYSIVTYAAALKTVDFIVEGLDRSKAAVIITSLPDEICSSLSDNFKTGMTRIQAKGGYSGQDKTMIYMVVNRFQITRLRNIVHQIDPLAYISISEIADIFRANIDIEKNADNIGNEEMPQEANH
jgi:uncharacterized membrane-anchored protein YitT (DUF2179 family)